jgi:DNA polymerase-1
MVQSLWEREVDLTNVVIDMESAGVEINQKFCRRKIATADAELNRIRLELGGRNPNSSRDLETMLIDELGFPVVRRSKKTGAPSFDKQAMEEYEIMLAHTQNKLGQNVLAYRGWGRTKVQNYEKYITLVSPDGRLRPNYNLHGARTGRFSCEAPNLQNIPKFGIKPWNGDVKQAFVAKAGFVLVESDYSQLELRLGAAYANQQNLLEAFNTPGRNVFREMAATLNRPYDQCKVFTYATLYGAQALKIGEILGLDPRDAKQFGDDWHNLYSDLVDLSNRVNATAKRRGYISYWTGRRRHFDHAWETRKGFNSLLQGGGAEVVKSAMIRTHHKVHKVKTTECRMVLQVHDSMVHEIREDLVEEFQAQIEFCMSDVMADSHMPNVRYLSRVPFPVESKVWGTK